MEATALTMRYGTIPALTECNLRVPAGHVVTLVGPTARARQHPPPCDGLSQSDGGHIRGGKPSSAWPDMC
jgi:hypothetical protein